MTPFVKLSSVVMLLGSMLLTGCFGYDRILFVTKTNVGLDVENKPPTAEITIARREIAIAPTFRDTVDKENKTPPLVAAFGRTGGLFTTGLKSHFAGGDAAYWLARGYPPENVEAGNGDTGNGDTGTTGGETVNSESAGGRADDVEGSGEREVNSETNDPKDENFSSICLDKEPDPRPPLKKFWHWLTGKPDENTRAFYFATDTVFGLKVGWDGTGGPYPTNLKLGYNRKELAFPPVFISEKVSEQDKCSIKDEYGELLKVNVEKPDGTIVEEVKPGYEVTVPSFFASLDNASGLADLLSTENQSEKSLSEGAAAGAAENEGIQSRKNVTVSHVQFFATGKAATEWVKRKKVNEKIYKQMRGAE